MWTKEERRKYDKEYRLKNRDKLRILRKKYDRKYRQTHNLKHCLWAIIDNKKRRRAEGSHTRQEWEDLKKKYNYTCLSCKRTEPEIKLTKDHIKTISLGGVDYIWNIQPLCGSCNSFKQKLTIDYRF